MRSYILCMIGVAVLALGVTSCNKPVADADVSPAPAPANPASSTGQVSPATPAAAPATGVNGLLQANPGLATCEPGSDVRFTWDVSARPGVTGVEVWVGDGDQAKLFTAGGVQGGESTGPWVKPGTLFILRDQAGGQELDRLMVQGPNCAGALP